jgi:hypothetical protein
MVIVVLRVFVLSPAKQCQPGPECADTCLWLAGEGISSMCTAVTWAEKAGAIGSKHELL